tara:strand:- start:84 stop:1619 length:1536 start_codon:yes stop_codon:yes gene_type:complete
MSKGNYNIIILKTDGTCQQIKTSKCDLVMKKNEPIYEHLNNYLTLSTNNEFEYIGLSNYNSNYNLYFFRVKTSSRIKNKNDIHALEIKNTSKNLKYITNDIWVIKSPNNSKNISHIYLHHWNIYYNKCIEKYKSKSRDSYIKDLKENSNNSNDKSKDKKKKLKGKKMNKKDNNIENDIENNIENDKYIEDDEDNTIETEEDVDKEDNDEIDNDNDDGDDDDDGEDDDEDNDDDGEDDDEEVKEEDLDKEDYEDEQLHDDDEDENNNYAEDDIGYEELRHVEYNSDSKKNNRNKLKKSFSKGNTIVINNKDDEDINKELEKGAISHLLKPEQNLQNIKSLVSIRKKCLKMIQTLFKKDEKNLAREIEKGIFNYSIEKCLYKEMYPSWDNKIFKEIYIGKVKSIYTNLNSKSYVKNIDFIHKVKLNEIQPENLASLKPIEVFPEMWEHIIKENEHREKVITESMMGAATDKFVCPNKKCRARKAVYTEVQTRSADEPMTLFISCLVCGKRWRM